jgi:hypothetical protein
MSSKKDPHNTLERLTLALEVVATSNATARERYERAWLVLLPLKPSDFPESEDRERHDRIFKTTPKTVEEEKLGECLRWVWELYWRMSGNTLYS